MKMRAKELFKFMKERQLIYTKKEAGQPKPWTKDPILQQYRFCNVYREQDVVTKWIAVHWRYPNRNDHELWFGMIVARLLNLPTSLDCVGWPVPWRESDFIKKLHKRQAAGHNIFNAAYIVSTNGISMDKVEYVAQRILTPIWAKRKDITAVIGNQTLGTVPPPTLAQVHSILTQFNGLGSFLAAQVIADLKQVQLRSASDRERWAASGPGSRRGLNRVCGHDPQDGWEETTWLSHIHHLQMQINTMIANQNQKAVLHHIDAQDLQNCLCEFDKYERVRLGQGRPKQKYEGATSCT